MTEEQNVSIEALLDRIEELEDTLSVFEAAAEGSDETVPWDKVKAEAALRRT
ncbi:MAG: hypothetical protein LC808_29775 [Actinobacteria bacterium]|nr:hypothetical protein [Actinomycetota bacterium]